MNSPATTLRDVNRTLFLEPLRGPEELETYYRGEDKIAEVRGGDRVREMAVALDRDKDSAKFKAFLMGRSGVGKSTEISRLIEMVGERYQPLSFSLFGELDRKRFAAYDIVLLICILLAEETHRVTGKTPERTIMSQLLDWYAEEEDQVTTDIKTAIDAAGGVDTKGTWWDKVVGAFVTLKGGITYAESRSSKSTAYKLKRIAPLIDISNALIRNCQHLLEQRHPNREWLIIGDDIDKPGFDVERVRELFLDHGATLFFGLEANLIFNLPLGLTYGVAAQELPSIQKFTIYDAAVICPDKTVNENTVEFISEILAARVDPDLFEEGQLRRLIIATGANLRDLFSTVTEAALAARVRGSDRIGKVDVESVIAKWRVQFQARLGTTPFGNESFSPETKIERLLKLYGATDTGAEVNDDVLGVLVGSGVVLEFNTTHWYGIHPLIVDALVRRGDLPSGAAGGTF